MQSKQTANQIIYQHFNNIIELSDRFKKYLDSNPTSNEKKVLKEDIFTIHSLFSLIENTLRDIKLTSTNKLIYELPTKLILDPEEKKYYIRLNNNRTYIWLNIFRQKTKTLQEIFKNENIYSKESYEKVILDINKIYRQIQIVYKVLIGETYTKGSTRKIKFKES